MLAMTIGSPAAAALRRRAGAQTAAAAPLLSNARRLMPMTAPLVVGCQSCRLQRQAKRFQNAASPHIAAIRLAGEFRIDRHKILQSLSFRLRPARRFDDNVLDAVVACLWLPSYGLWLPWDG
jgi:hypothetical protein